MVPDDPPVQATLKPDNQTINVELVISAAPRQVQRSRLCLPLGSSVCDALLASGLMTKVPGLTPEAMSAGQWSLGVWGRRERLGHILRDRDRIEVVRPLLVDPKEARRLRYQDHLKKWPKGSQRLQKGKKTAQSSGG